VAADLHPSWFGTEEGRDVAREIFALPQVELGSHTFSHPFDWGFFEDGITEKERPYLSRYSKSWGQSPAVSFLTGWFSNGGYEQQASEVSHEDYEKPRAYAVRPFDLGLEVTGAAEYLETLAPRGKRVELLQWSGNTLPFEEALRRTRVAGLANMNGGDTRFDRDYSSVAWVAPVGRVVGNEFQVYASNSNENTYTDLWRDRYFGFIHLIRTFENTETPVRLKPLNVYYHMYSGERLSSLNALLANLRYVREQEICPVAASRFAKIAAGFFTCRIQRTGEDTWRIQDRGELQTIRFDRATFSQVDFTRSRGVIGQRHLQGSLYVALDPSVQEPIIALRRYHSYHRLPDADRPYLIDARWRVWGFISEQEGFTFATQGFGDGKFRWKVPESGTSYEIKWIGQDRESTLVAASDEFSILTFDLGSTGIEPQQVRVLRK
jgi:hypothetical protein